MSEPTDDEDHIEIEIYGDEAVRILVNDNVKLRERIGGDCIGCNRNDGPDEYCPMHGRTLVDWMEIASEVIGRHNDDRAEIERLRAELSALRAHRWYSSVARAVAERDAAREAVGRVLELCDEYRANCDPTSRQAEVAELFRVALEGGAAT